MNKVDIANTVHGKLGGTKVQAEEVVDVVIDSIVSTLKKGGEVSIAGLGIFSTKVRAARQARNPVPGKPSRVHRCEYPSSAQLKH